MLRKIIATVALLLASKLAGAQGLPRYEIHEAEYRPFGNQTEFHAKVIDRVNNVLWFCAASLDAATGLLSAQCRDSLATNVPNLSRLVTAESIAPISSNSSANPIHWWLLDPGSGAITFCMAGLACQPARYSR